MKPEIFFDLPRADYDAIDAVNFSTLKHMRRSPLHYRAAKAGGFKDSTAKKFGRVAHVAVLEPDRLASEVAVWTEGDRRGKAYKDFEAANQGREILKPDEYAEVLALRDAVASDAVAQTYLRVGRPEVSIRWSLELVPGFFVHLKSRLDWVGPNGIVDLKSTRDARPESFGRDVVTLDYLAQAAFYVDAYAAAVEPLPFRFAAVESAAPHCVRVYRVTDQQLAAGRKTYSEWLAKLAWCREMNLWPGYDGGEQELVLPHWADLSTEEVEEGEAHVQ